MGLGVFLAYPLIEIFIFILVAKLTSWKTVLLLTLATSFLGYVLLRCQRRWQIFGRNDFSSRSIENYLFANLGSFALLMPGFLSDVFGLLVIVPWTRRLLLAFFRVVNLDVNKAATGPFSVFRTYSFGGRGPQGFDARSANGYPGGRADDYSSEYPDGDDVVDVESYDAGESRAQRNDDGGDDDAIDVEYTVRG